MLCRSGTLLARGTSGWVPYMDAEPLTSQSLATATRGLAPLASEARRRAGAPPADLRPGLFRLRFDLHRKARGGVSDL